MPDLTPVPSIGTVGSPWVAGSADELLAGAADHVRLDPADGKSGSRIERVTIDGEPYVVKALSPRTDWIMRIIHDPDHWSLRVWRAGILHEAPPEIDPTVVGMALDGTGDDAVLTTLMRDVGEHLVPEGDEPVTPEQHLALIDGLAALSARFWGWRDELDLCPMANRFRFFAPDNIAPELERVASGVELPVPLRVADEGWRRLPHVAPALADVTRAIHAEPEPLVDALAETPATFLHGDWKMGNLGVHPGGRTILLDWAYPGSGPCCWDLAWYLALNRARIPISKEDTIAYFRHRLEARGIATDGWFDRQLALALLGIMAAFAWEKAVGDDDELRWWERAALDGAAQL